MRVTFLGTGAAGGVPLFGCSCRACVRARLHKARVRLPCSALVETADSRILLDAGLTDLHERFAPGDLDAIVLTHFHPDHVQGLLHLRWGIGDRIPVCCPADPEGCADLYKHPGLLDFRALTALVPFMAGDLKLTPLPLNHSKPTLGYAIESADGCRFAYLTDTLGLPAASAKFLADWQADGLALDCSYPPHAEPKGHNDWSAALAVIAQVKPARTWFTHISHKLDAWLLDTQTIPAGLTIAGDGEQIEFTARAYQGRHSE